MARNASDILIETLQDWGVDTIFGLPGDGINGLVEALRIRQEEVRFIQVRHEETAAFMACAYAKFTGRLGVCLATSGPGGIHLLNGLYDAKLDGAPVLAITGLQHHDLIGTSTQQDVELDKLFMDVAYYNTRVMGAAHVENVTSIACRTALSRRGVAHITIPVDVQEEAVDDDGRSPRNVADHVSDIFSSGKRLPDEEQLARAAAIINAGKRVVILAGAGAIGAAAQLESLAERLGAPVVKALLGKGALPDDSPYTTGGTGLLGTEPSQEAMENCDTLIILGSAFPYVEYYPKPGAARCVQVDIKPERIGLRYPAESALVGDCGDTIDALLPRLDHKEDRSFLEKAQAGMKDWRERMTERGTRTDMPMKPQVVTYELDKLLTDDAIVTTDSGTITTWVARHVTMRDGMLFSCSGNLATMACGLPYAMAAALAYPGRQIVAVVGDGGFSMLMAELATCVKYDLDIKLIIIKNNSLGQIKWEQMVFLGNPEYGCELQPIDFAKVAGGFGVHAVTIERPDQCAAQLQGVLARPGPLVVEAVVDPHEPPMPPKATLSQVNRLGKALVRGTPEGGKIARRIGADVIREIV